MKYNLLKLVASISLISILAACGDDAAEASSEDTQQEQTEVQKKSEESSTSNSKSKVDTVNPDYVVAADPSNAPFDMRGTDGGVMGLDSDIINAIAQDQDFTYMHKPTKWENIFASLDDGSSDIISGLVVDTAERREKYDFSNPVFYKKRYAYMLNEVANNYRIGKFEDICQLKVAVKEGTDKSKLYDETCGGNNPKRVGVESSYTAFEQMVGGKVDVAIGDDILFAAYIKEFKLKDLKLLAEPNAKEITLAWPVKKGHEELLTKFNTGLAHLKENGQYDAILKKWLGDDFQMKH